MLNYEKKIERKNNVFASWEKRNLTILGKIFITKSLIVSIFTYVSSSCIVPEKYIKKIKTKCYKFFGKNEPDKVKRLSFKGKYEEGGLISGAVLML